MSSTNQPAAFEGGAPEQLKIGDPVSHVRGDTEGLFAGLPKERIEEWRDFHKANPWVWDRFKKYAHQLRIAGARHAGARMIVERIRWDIESREIKVIEGFAINNNHVALYARLLAMKEPHFFRHFFEFREMKTGGGENES
jgi:hypothetical protein